jgi:hypothetical protein
MSDAASEPKDTEEDVAAAPPEEDDVKRRFREALERKRNGGDAHGEGSGRGRSKVRGVHGAASHQKSFRRKSG